MAIFRCNKCGHIREVGNDYLGKSVKCPKCEQVTTIHDTIPFIRALIKKYIGQKEELQNLRQAQTETEEIIETVGEVSLEEVDVHNTNVLTRSDNVNPILQWFDERKIGIHVTPEAVDTTGFFDEIALLLGDKFDVLSLVSGQIKYIQNKGYSNVKIDISKKNSSEIQLITSFCKELYDYSFVGKYYYHQKDKIIHLTLQRAPKIRDFFNGIWMEWFTLIKLLEFFSEQQMTPACGRSLEITFPGGNSNELDLFFLTEKNIPICIECKTGEFRQDIDKYLSLRKRLHLEKEQFVLCIFGLSLEQAQGMTSMYDITFVNETSLIQHIQTIV
jgi:phage FluMu protein Com